LHDALPISPERRALQRTRRGESEVHGNGRGCQHWPVDPGLGETSRPPSTRTARRERMLRRRADRTGASEPVEAGGDHRYQLRQRLVSIGDDYWIENAQGERVFKVDGKALR